MSEAPYTEVSTQGWFSRIKESFKSVLIGLVLFIVAFPVLWWNEGRAVNMAASIGEVAKKCVLINVAAVNPANEGKPVHATADAVSAESLADAEFGVSVSPAIKLLRKVEMYQYKERKETTKEKNLGGSETTVTKYFYDKVWSSEPLDSSQFKVPEGHQNPAMSYRSDRHQAGNVSLGAFKLNPEQVAEIGGAVPVPLGPELLNTLPQALAGKTAKLVDNALYVGQDASTPAIGDLRIAFAVVKSPATVSIVAQQTGASFQPCQTKYRAIQWLATGAHSKDEMVAAAKSANSQLTWILRLVGFVLMAIGLGLLASPLAVLMDVLPFLGDLVRFGAFLFAALAAFGLSLITIALAWLFYRPWLSIPMLLLVIGGTWWLARQGKARKATA